MDTNTVTAAEDAEMTDCDGEKVVTMMDVLQEQEDFENDANAVLGASDEKNCTYTKGYIKRQAIYACMTCCAEAKDDPSKRAGVCLACSLICHENHELIELYTKRNFRCDCGNPKFNSNPCQYISTKTELNENNEYNQNFSGLYCVCHRPYPDPDTTIEDEMIQCIICEDWLHASHLEATLPPNDHYSEMICKSCMEKNLFLHDYSNLAVNVENDVVDVVGDNTENTVLNTDLKNDEVQMSEETSAAVAENTILNTDLKNDQVQMSEEISAADDIQETPDKLEEGNNTNIDDNAQENTETSLTNKFENEPNSSVKDTNDANVIPSGLNKDKHAKQEFNSETTNNIQESVNVSKTNLNVDGESIDEDKLLADPEEEGVVEPSNQKESESEDNQTNKDTPETQDSEVISDTISNKGDSISKDTKGDLDTDKKENNENDKNIVANINSEVKDDILDGVSLDEKNIENTENESDDKADEQMTSGKDKENEQLPEKAIDQSNGIDYKQDTVRNDTEVAEDTILDASKSDLECNNAERNVAQNIKDSTNKEDNDDETNDKTDLERNNEESNEEQNIEDSSTTNKDNNDDSKTALAVNNEENNVAQNIKDFCEKKEDNDNNEENTEVEMKDEIEIVNGSDGKTSENKRKLSTEENANKVEDSGIGRKRVKLDCICSRPKNIKRVYKGATFWPSDFRKKLCTCNECLTMYKDLSVLFLTDLEDTVRAYENLGEEKERIEGKPASQYEKGLQALSSLDRIQQINALTEYNKMRDKLLEFLKSFKDRKEVVKEEDIKEFFAGMKPKREPDGVYFCR